MVAHRGDRLLVCKNNDLSLFSNGRKKPHGCPETLFIEGPERLIEQHRRVSIARQELHQCKAGGQEQLLVRAVAKLMGLLEAPKYQAVKEWFFLPS